MLCKLSDRLIINTEEVLYLSKDDGKYFLIFKNGFRIDIWKEDFLNLSKLLDGMICTNTNTTL